MRDKRWRLRVIYSGIMLFAYFGFFLLCAFRPTLMAAHVFGGSPASYAMWLGAAIIAGSVVMSGLYTVAADKA